MIVGCLVLVECVRCQVQHTIIQSLVLQNLLICLTHLLWSLTLALWHKHSVVKITLVYRPQVYQTEHQNNAHRILLLQFTIYYTKQHACTNKNNVERAHCISSKHSLTHIYQVACKWSYVLLRQCCQCSYLAARNKVVEEHGWHYTEQQGYTTCQRKAYAHILHSGLHHFWLVKQFLKRHHGQQWNGEFSYYEYRCHRTELGVHWDVIEEEVGESHEVLTPRQQYREYCYSQQCPLHRAFYDKQSQNKQHHHKCAHVNRSASTRLLAPVLTYLLIYALVGRISLLHGNLTLAHGHRCTTLGVRHQQSPGLVDTITPLGNIIALQSAIGLVGRVFLHQLTLSAHRLLSVLPCVVHVTQVYAHSDSRTSYAHSSGLGKLHVGLFAYGIHQPCYYHRQNNKQIVIRHLHVVGVNLKGSEDCCKQESPQIFAPVSQHYTRNHWWQVSQRPHLPYVSCGNDNQEIGAECPYNRA